MEGEEEEEEEGVEAADMVVVEVPLVLTVMKLGIFQEIAH